MEQNRRALRILRAHGIEPNVGFIMFEPGSSLADVRVNLDFLEEERLLERLAVTANVLCHQQIVLRPTPAYRRRSAAGPLVVSPHDRYEGTVPYRHSEVAFLAETMAEACRHVFAGVPRELVAGVRRGRCLEANGAAPDAALLAVNGGPRGRLPAPAGRTFVRRAGAGLRSSRLDVVAEMRGVVAEACSTAAPAEMNERKPG